MEGASLHGATESWDTKFKKFENYQRERIEKMQGTLMLVATVIATMTFQIAINPPGGVWQEDSSQVKGCADQMCKAGTSVLAFSNSNQNSTLAIFVVLCTISFSTSQTVILLLICGFSLKNRLIMWVLIIAMCISVLCTTAAYIISIRMVMNSHDDIVTSITGYYALYWVGLVVLLCLVPPCRFICWLLKKCLKCCCCCCWSSHRHRQNTAA